MNLIKYCKDSYSELVHKTSWSTRQETIHNAIVVLVASIVLSVVIFAFDAVFEKIMDLIYHF